MQVFVDGKKVVKAGTLIKPTAQLEIRAEEPKFVCRAGAKLEVVVSFSPSPAYNDRV